MPVQVSTHPPFFRHRRLPSSLAAGSNKSGPYNDESIKFLASHFPMVTIEKFQGPCGYKPNASPACHQESLIIAELKRVKTLNPNVGRSRSGPPDSCPDSIIKINFFPSHGLQECCKRARGLGLPAHLRANRWLFLGSQVSAIFYYNSVLDFPQYDLHGMFLARPDRKGRSVSGHSWPA